MTSLILWRLLKYVGLLLIAAGTAGAFAPERLELRRRLVHGLATAGLAITWIAGFGLMRAAGWSMKAPWIGGSIILLLAWYQAVMWAVETDERRQPKWAIVASLPLLAALVLMVVRPG